MAVSSRRLLAIIEATSITGPAKNLLQFAQLSCRRDPGLDVTLAVFQRGFETTQFLETVQELGLPLRVIPEQGALDRGVLPRLRELVAQVQPDVIQTHAVKSHLLVRVAGLHRMRPWVAFHHGYTWNTKKALIYNYFDFWSLRAADHVVTVTEAFRGELQRVGVRPDRLTIVHNAISPWLVVTASETAQLRQRWGIPAGRKVLVIVGRLSREKDHVTLLEAMAVARQRLADGGPHLLVVGEGPERRGIEQAMARLNLNDRVVLTGHQPSAGQFYAMADIAVLSSLTEGSPNALLEAMVAGLPVIATRVGGVPEIATDGETALLVAPGSREAMADALVQLMTDEQFAKELGARGREHVEANYTPEKRVSKLLAVYQAVCERRPAPPIEHS